MIGWFLVRTTCFLRACRFLAVFGMVQRFRFRLLGYLEFKVCSGFLVCLWTKEAGIGPCF